MATLTKPAVHLRGHTPAVGDIDMFGNLKHLWMMDRAADFIEDSWGNNHGTGTAGVSRNVTDNGTGLEFSGGAGSDEIALNAVPDFGDGTKFTILAAFSTRDTAETSDPKILSVEDSGAVEKLRIDWDNPGSTKVARIRCIISGTQRDVLFAGEMIKNRSYTMCCRFDGAKLYSTLWDWDVFALNEGSTAAAGALDSVVGGNASIGNAAGTANREWDGTINMVAIWAESFTTQKARELCLNPYGWLEPVSPYPYYGSAVVAAPAGDVRSHVIPAYMRVNA